MTIKEKPKNKYPYYIEAPLEYKRVDAFLKAFSAILEHSNYKFILDLYTRISMKCARCASGCQIYQTTGKPEDIPCYRSSILLRIYKRHFTLGGWMKSKLTGGSGITEKDIDEMLESYYQCTACRRCTFYCPMGIEHGMITHLGRYILAEIGIVPKALQVSVREQLEGASKNTSAIPVPALIDTLEFLEEEIEETKGIKVKFPIDVEGAEYVFFAPVSDYLLEADTLMGMACVLQTAGISWTIGTGNYDGINYGLFYSDDFLGKIVRNEIDEVRRLKGKKILIGECGHASRTAKNFVPTYNEGSEIPVVNLLELTLKLLEEGKIELDPNVITEKVTYHDPCNYVRSGWIIEQPRKIIKSFIKNFVEMTPNGKYNLCCGGGGGTVSVDEVKDFRMNAAGKKKADQLRATGADIVITPCANCKKQIEEVIEYFDLPMKRMGLHDLILKAIKLK
ncbi:MAG: (Fe-S)-binding protein [Fibrobacteria bacterium]|nr:(Fe-S)-binding protein [Fibrobacteria bacterium]